MKDVSNYYNDIKVENNPWTESTIGQNSTPNDGGCLIATAAYDSEMSPQVQQFLELRDNQLLQTESGTAFMGTFNDIYYSFSPCGYPLASMDAKTANELISCFKANPNSVNDFEGFAVGTRF